MKIRILDINLVEMTDDVYFSDKYADYVSNSRLSLLNPSEGGSVQKFKDGFPKGFNPSFVTGTAIHEMVLQPDLFFLAPDLEKPSAKMGAIADFLYDNFYKTKKNISMDDCEKAGYALDYYSNSLTPKRVQTIHDKCSKYLRLRYEYESVLNDSREPIYLDADNLHRVTECVKNVESNVAIQDILNPFFIGDGHLNRNEDAIIANIELIDDNGRAYPVKIKQKMDNFTYDPGINELILNDLKSTGRFLDQFERSFYDYRYFRQIGMYLWFLAQFVRAHYPNSDKLVMKANILLTCTIPDFRSGLFKVWNHQILHGVWAFREMLKILMENYDEIYD